MRPARAFDAWITKSFPPPLSKMVVTTNDTIKNELFGSFELCSEVKAFGSDLLKANGHTQIAKQLASFRSYIRQARYFYEAADALHHRASPLLYYYSFANFAKAYVLLRDPQFVDNKLQHGLTYHFRKGALRRQSVVAMSNGVFPLFYGTVTGARMPNNARLNAASLLSYASDVSLEFEKLKFGTRRFFPGNLAMVKNRAIGKAHPILAINTWGAARTFRPFAKKHLKAFDEVDLRLDHAKLLFDLTAETKPAFQFFETTKDYADPNPGNIPVQPMMQDIVQIFGPLMSPDPFNDGGLYRLNLPIATPSMKPMQEILAIYCLMFYLGTLVRYRPQFLDTLLATKDAWIVERLVKQTPITFLRLMRNLIDGSYWALGSR